MFLTRSIKDYVSHEHIYFMNDIERLHLELE